MPKIPENAKRVPLNCLVRPDTKQEIQERAVNGKSQGDVIDEAMSALYRETGTAYDPHIEPSATEALPVPKTPLRLAKPARPFKGPLLKPKDRKKEQQ
jgi:hypothetical protein